VMAGHLNEDGESGFESGWQGGEQQGDVRAFYTRSPIAGVPACRALVSPFRCEDIADCAGELLVLAAVSPTRLGGLGRHVVQITKRGRTSHD
jgi:hypothetical protein